MWPAGQSLLFSNLFWGKIVCKAMMDLHFRLRKVPASMAPFLAACLCLVQSSPAQDNYEIQVYPSETLEKGRTMVELHSNFTADGRRTTQNGVLPTHHAFHETLEITHGFTPWFETGFYVFTSARDGDGWQWVVDHIRPRVRVP